MIQSHNFGHFSTQLNMENLMVKKFRLLDLWFSLFQPKAQFMMKMQCEESLEKDQEWMGKD